MIMAINFNTICYQYGNCTQDKNKGNDMMKNFKIGVAALSAIMLLTSCNLKPADSTGNNSTAETTSTSTATTTAKLKSQISDISFEMIDTVTGKTVDYTKTILASKEYPVKTNVDFSKFDVVINKILESGKRKVSSLTAEKSVFIEKIPGSFKYSLDFYEKGTQNLLGSKELNLKFMQSDFTQLTTKLEAVKEKSVSYKITPVERVYIYSSKDDKSNKVWKIIPGQLCELTSERDANGWVKLKVLGKEGYTNYKNFVQVPIFESQGKTDKYLDYQDAVSTKKMLEIIGKLADKDNARIASTPDEYKAGDWIIEEMKKLGYTSKRYPFKMPRGTWLETPTSSDTSYNIESVLPNYDPNKKDIYFIGHYDSITTPGANDNASAVAMNMEIARYLATRDDLNFNPVIFFPGCEEVKMTGSWSYVEEQMPKERRQRISLIINSDMIARQNLYQIWANNIDNFNLPQHLLAKDIALNLGLRTAQVVGTYSDNVAFEVHGIPAVSFLNINDEQYHTDMDTVENCSEETLMNFGNIILNIMEIQNMKLGQAAKD